MLITVVLLGGLVMALWIARPWRQEPVEIVLGGLYSTRKWDGGYGIVKVLAIQDNMVHLCAYRNRYRRRPRRLNPTSLSVVLNPQEIAHLDTSSCYVGLPHIPLAMETFCHGDYVYISQTPVTPAELAWEQDEIQRADTVVSIAAQPHRDLPRQVVIMESWGQGSTVVRSDNDDESWSRLPASA